MRASVTFATTLLLLSSHRAWAGDGPGKLSCRTRSAEQGSVTLEGLIPLTESTLQLTLKSGAGSLEITDQDWSADVVEALEQNVFTFTARANKGGGHVQLFAIPKTVKASKKRLAIHASFEAVLDAPHPRSGGVVNSAKDMLTGVKLSCALDWEP